jgi:lipopolysaccharide transport system ATP-binding protein
MNARLGFALAAHLRPDALIIDEVLSVGDMAFQQKCYSRMVDFKKQGIAIVLVSHNLQAVATLCDNAVYLANDVRCIGPAISVLEAYVRSSQKAATSPPSSPVTLESGTLNRQADIIGSHGDVRPGASLSLRITGTSHEPLCDVTFGFIINRSTDQLTVYDGNIHLDELVSTPLLGRFTLEFNFKVHLVRGHYYISVHVFDNRRQSFLVPVRQIATLTVTEHRSWQGIADVELSAMLSAEKELVE